MAQPSMVSWWFLVTHTAIFVTDVHTKQLPEKLTIERERKGAEVECKERERMKFSCPKKNKEVLLFVLKACAITCKERCKEGSSEISTSGDSVISQQPLHHSPIIYTSMAQ